MATLLPPQNPVAVYVFTLTGWIHGVLHVPLVNDLISFLNAQTELLKLTDVTLPGAKPSHSFLALHRSAALLVIPVDVESCPGSMGVLSQRHHPVTCLLGHGSLAGYLKVPNGIRTSDYLMQSSGFIELSQCHLGSMPGRDSEHEGDRTWPVVLVNSRSILGVAE